MDHTRLAARLRRFSAALLIAAAVSPAAAQEERITPVRVDVVRNEPISQTVPVIGRLVARQSGVVAARARGPVAELRANVGDRVKKGEVVAVLVRDRLGAERQLRAAEVSQATAMVETAKAQITYVIQEMKRLEGLRASAAFSQARYEDKHQEVVKAESAKAEKEAALKRALVNLRLAEIELRDTEIRAPYAGVVSLRHTEVGSYLSVGDPVVTLIDDEHLEVEAEVPAKRVPGLVSGAPVIFRLDDSTVLPAIVRAVVPEENPLTRTRTVRFTPRFDGAQDNLASNQSVTLQLPVGAARNAVTVHKDAVLNRSDETIVFIVSGEMAKVRSVKLGESIGGRFEVIAGLKPGDLVVVRGNERLRPGQKVRYERKS